MDEIKKNLECLAREMERCIGLRIDALKLLAVEEIASLLQRLLVFVVVSVSIFFAFFFFLLALALALVPLLGGVGAVLSVALLFVLVAALLWFLRGRLFVNVGVRALCRFFFR